jgi:23S rRNA pseudouridine1911/1915/1917 synthase
MAESEQRTLIVPEGTRKQRADKALAAACPELSRVAVQRAFDDELVLIEGDPVPKGRRVSAGDVITFSFSAVRSYEVVARDIPLNVLFEDEHLVVINKPPGMVVHPGAGTGEDTLVHALLSHCHGQLSGIGGVERPGIVHRLDRDTSGVMVAAKTDPAHRKLAEAFAARETQKEYLALIMGVPELMSGTIRKPIARDAARRHRMAVVNEGGGREAHTDWQREELFGKTCALVRCFIHTGRTHQIRVHMKSIGHPIIGDRVYGWRADTRLPIEPPRVMLHAARLAFTHPIAGDPVDVTAPLPDDFLATIETIRSIAK